MSLFKSLRKISYSILSLGRQQVPILMYHRVHLEQDYMRLFDMKLDEFEWQMELVADNFEVYTVSEVINRWLKGKLPPNALCITFDDGYVENETLVLPVLERLGLTATFYVTTLHFEGKLVWVDQIIEAIREYTKNELNLKQFNLGVHSMNTNEEKYKASLDIIGKLKRVPYSHCIKVTSYISSLVSDNFKHINLSEEQLIKLDQSGIEIGGHTHVHPILANVDDKFAKQDIQNNKNIIEEILDHPITGFAYPNGKPEIDFYAIHQQIVKNCGYHYAVSTHQGMLLNKSNRYAIPRGTPWDTSSLKFFIRLALNKF